MQSNQKCTQRADGCQYRLPGLRVRIVQSLSYNQFWGKREEKKEKEGGKKEKKRKYNYTKVAVYDIVHVQVGQLVLTAAICSLKLFQLL